MEQFAEQFRQIRSIHTFVRDTNHCIVNRDRIAIGRDAVSLQKGQGSADGCPLISIQERLRSRDVKGIGCRNFEQITRTVRINIPRMKDG